MVAFVAWDGSRQDRGFSLLSRKRAVEDIVFGRFAAREVARVCGSEIVASRYEVVFMMESMEEALLFEVFRMVVEGVRSVSTSVDADDPAVFVFVNGLREVGVEAFGFVVVGDATFRGHVRRS